MAWTTSLFLNSAPDSSSLWVWLGRCSREHRETPTLPAPYTSELKMASGAAWPGMDAGPAAHCCENLGRYLPSLCLSFLLREPDGYGCPPRGIVVMRARAKVRACREELGAAGAAL